MKWLLLVLIALVVIVDAQRSSRSSSSSRKFGMDRPVHAAMRSSRRDRSGRSFGGNRHRSFAVPSNAQSFGQRISNSARSQFPFNNHFGHGQFNLPNRFNPASQFDSSRLSLPPVFGIPQAASELFKVLPPKEASAEEVVDTVSEEVIEGVVVVEKVVAEDQEIEKSEVSEEVTSARRSTDTVQIPQGKKKRKGDGLRKRRFGKRGETCFMHGSCGSCFDAGCFWQATQADGFRCQSECKDTDEACFGTFPNVPAPHNVITCPTSFVQDGDVQVLQKEDSAQPVGEYLDDEVSLREHSTGHIIPSKPSGPPPQAAPPAATQVHHQGTDELPVLLPGEKFVSCVENIWMTCNDNQPPPPLPQLQYPVGLGLEGEVCVFVARHMCIPRLPQVGPGPTGSEGL